MKGNSIEKDIKILETFLNGTKCCNGCEIVCANYYEEGKECKHYWSEKE